MPFFLALFKSIKKAMIASNLLMLFFFFLSSYMLLRSFKVKRNISYFYSIFLTLPFNVIMVDMHVLSQYYLIQLIGMCVTISLFNYITEVNTIKKCAIMCLGGGISLFETLNGSRYVALIILPLALLGVYLLYEIGREKCLKHSIDKEYIARMLYLLAVGTGAGIGYIVYLVMTNHFSTYAGDALGFTAIYDLSMDPIVFLDRIKEIFYLWLIFWGFRLEGQNMASFKGLETLICLFMPILITILMVKIIIGSKDKKIKYFVYYIALSLAVSFLLMAIMESVIPTVRYLYFGLYLMLFLVPVYFQQRTLQDIISSFGDTILVIISICFIVLTQLSTVDGIKERWQMETSDVTTVADYREDVNNWLIEHEYQYGYATYWNANVGTVLSDCQVNYCGVYIGGDVQIYPFFGGAVREYYNSAAYKGKTFIMLTQDENIQMENTLPANWVEQYSNDMFIVYGYEDNPYDFSVELLQYFPVKGEVIILEGNNFFTQGTNTDNVISVEKNDAGAYLTYGPSMNFPIDAVYDIEYNFIVEKAAGEPSGYIAVTANGTEEIAREEFAGIGEFSLTLEDVSIHSDASMVQFIIYLNAGCEAMFKDIRIERVR